MKIKFILLTFLISTVVVAQQKDNFSKKNELKLNALYLVLGAFDASYERLLNEDSGVGVSLTFANSEDTSEVFGLTTYYRMYFGKKPAAGFFFEGFGMLNTQQGKDYLVYTYENGNYNYYTFKPEKSTDFALGFGIGGKWINKKGVFFEISSGVGRNLFNPKSKELDYKYVGRGGISIGYRF